MKAYLGQNNFRDLHSSCAGILVVNLGTPDAPTASALRRYLAEFLWDPRVIEAPRWLWGPILHGIILRIRPRRSAAAYAKIWNRDGSPLLTLTRRVALALDEELRNQVPGPFKIAVGMRYGHPSIVEALENLRQQGIHRLLVLPLYPQYSASTTGSAFDAITHVLQHWRWVPELRMITHYHDYPPYIEALTQSVKDQWSKEEGKAKEAQTRRLLFSFHGLPQRYSDAGDPYFYECHKTALLVAGRLGLKEGEWKVAFQSRFGREEWLKPYTDTTLVQWANSGVQNVQVICPGFSVDCLETLEEIDIENRARFLESGGKIFSYIAALNDRRDHIQALASLVRHHTQGWPEFSSRTRAQGQTELLASDNNAATVNELSGESSSG